MRISAVPQICERELDTERFGPLNPASDSLAEGRERDGERGALVGMVGRTQIAIVAFVQAFATDGRLIASIARAIANSRSVQTFSGSKVSKKSACLSDLY